MKKEKGSEELQQNVNSGCLWGVGFWRCFFFLLLLF